MANPAPSLSDVYQMVLQEEEQQGLKSNATVDSEASAMAAQRGNFNGNYSSNGKGNSYDNRGNQRPNYFNGGSANAGKNEGTNNYSAGRNDNTGKIMFCDHCKAKGHTIDRCWKLHGYPTQASPGIAFCNHCKLA